MMDFISVRCKNRGDMKSKPDDISTVDFPIGDESWHHQSEMHTVCITDLVDVGPVERWGDETQYWIELKYNRIGSQCVKVYFQNAPLAFRARRHIVASTIENCAGTHEFFPPLLPKDRD